ncbi:MAG: hypothetical protein HFE50_01415 [Clostridia bacterium]|nr:hypothetical protein [Clostridia bacterium]
MKKIFMLSIIYIYLLITPVFAYAIGEENVEHSSDFVQSSEAQFDANMQLVETMSLFPNNVSPFLGHTAMPSTGNVNTIAIIIDFPDVPIEWTPETTTSQVEKLLQDTSRHYKKASYGKLNLSSDIFYCMLPKNYSEYKEAYFEGSIIKDALLLLERDGVDFSKYDSNNDGYIDGIYIYVKAGNMGDMNGVLGYCHYVEVEAGEKKTVDSAWMPITGKSHTCIHETGHLLGLRDRYSNIYEDAFSPLLHDVMGRGEESYHNIVDKYLLGWIDPVIISGNGKSLQDLKIYRQELQNLEGTQAIIFVPDEEKLPFTEFYMLEYRRTVKGIYLWHADLELETIGTRERILNPERDIRIVNPSGDTLFSPTKDAYKERKVFSPYTVPSSDFYDDIYTGIYMQVLEANDDYAVIKGGFPDKFPLVADVSYSVTEPTNQNVTATVTFPEPVIITGGGEYLTKTDDELIYTAEFTENAEYTIDFTDLSGNYGEKFMLKVDWIDKEPPTVERAAWVPTNQVPVFGIAFIKFSEPVILTEGQEYAIGSLSAPKNGYNFREICDISFVDVAGNVGGKVNLSTLLTPTPTPMVEGTPSPSPTPELEITPNPIPTSTPTATPSPSPTPEPSDRVAFIPLGNLVSARLIFEKTAPPKQEDIQVYVVYREDNGLKRVEMPVLTDMTFGFVIPEQFMDCDISVYIWDKNMIPLMDIQNMQ